MVIFCNLKFCSEGVVSDVVVIKISVNKNNNNNKKKTKKLVCFRSDGVDV